MNSSVSLTRLYLGLIVITLIAIPGYLTATSLDMAQFIAMTAFAIALPLLAYSLLSQTEAMRQSKTANVILGLINMLAMLIDITGITAAFWHIAWFIGILFIVTLFIVIIVFKSLQYITSYKKGQIR